MWIGGGCSCYCGWAAGVSTPLDFLGMDYTCAGSEVAAVVVGRGDG